MAAARGDGGDTRVRYRTVLLMWASLLGGVLSFAALAWVLVSGLVGDPWSPFLDRGPARLLLGLAVVLMVAGILVRRSEWGGAPSSDPLVVWQRRSVVGWALQEGGGLLGVVLSLGAGEPVWILVMAGLSAFALLRTRPTREEVEGLGLRR